MSKVSMPRPRYIAVRITSARAVSRRAFQNALLGRARREGWQDADAPQLTRYAYPDAIVRVEHTRQQDARSLLPRIDWVVEGDARVDVKVATTMASGTLRALTAKTGLLAERPRRAGGGRSGPPAADVPPSAGRARTPGGPAVAGDRRATPESGTALAPHGEGMRQPKDGAAHRQAS